MLIANKPVFWFTTGAVKLRERNVGGWWLGVMMPCSALTAGCTLLEASAATKYTCTCRINTRHKHICCV